MEYFLKIRPKNYQCNHKNGIKADNRIGNLEWTTQSKNTKHAYDKKLIINNKTSRNVGSKNGKSKLTEIDILEIRKLYKKGLLQKELMKKYNVCSSKISSIINYKSWKHVPKKGIT